MSISSEFKLTNAGEKWTGQQVEEISKSSRADEERVLECDLIKRETKWRIYVPGQNHFWSLFGQS